jgi:hypothetical protein
MAASSSPAPASTPAPAPSVLAATPSASSSSRRWADYSDDEDDLTPRSYCEVLRSGSPPSPSPVAARPLSPAAQGGARPWSAALRQLAAEAGSSPKAGADVVGAGSPRVDGPAGGVGDAELPAGGVGPWIHVGGRRRPRGQRSCRRCLFVKTCLPISPDSASIAFCRRTTSPGTAPGRRRAFDAARGGTMPVIVPRDGRRREVGGRGSSRVKRAGVALRQRSVSSRVGLCSVSVGFVSSTGAWTAWRRVGGRCLLP